MQGGAHAEAVTVGNNIRNLLHEYQDVVHRLDTRQYSAQQAIDALGEIARPHASMLRDRQSALERAVREAYAATVPDHPPGRARAAPLPGTPTLEMQRAEAQRRWDAIEDLMLEICPEPYLMLEGGCAPASSVCMDNAAYGWYMLDHSATGRELMPTCLLLPSASDRNFYFAWRRGEIILANRFSLYDMPPPAVLSARGRRHPPPPAPHPGSLRGLPPW